MVANLGSLQANLTNGATAYPSARWALASALVSLFADHGMLSP